jgi:PKHD-type hydroxylase
MGQGELILKTGDNFSYAEGVISDEEINILMKYWEGIDTSPEITNSNMWDVRSTRKTVIDSIPRRVEIVGIPVDAIGFLSEKIERVFSMKADYKFGIEGPHYFTKYPTGGYHTLHIDDGIHNGVKRDMTITIQLSDPKEYSGGDLIINGEVAPRSKGTFILYRGTDPHEVTAVTSGERLSITECAGCINNH